MNELIYVMVSPVGMVSPIMTLAKANELFDQDGYENHFLCRLTVVDCANGSLEKDFRDSGDWPIGHK